MTSRKSVFGSILVLFLFMFCVSPAHAQKRPNIIYILADDLGYGDLGCYGQKTLRTPNLDRMAVEGMRFTRHYAGSTVCAPSRCVLLTGLHTGHCRIRGNGPGQLLKTDVTFATLLRRLGYSTGAFGKWGIGNPPPLDDPHIHGFDEFYGYINMFHAHNYYPEFLIRNGKKVPLRNKLFPDWHKKSIGPREGAGVAKAAADYAPKLIADAMLQFIRKNQKKPFFVYYALNIPHANNEAGRDDRIARNGMRVPDLGVFAKKNWPIQEIGFARMIEMIDDDVGRILTLVRDLGIDENTIVLFSSDNGPHQEGGHLATFFDSNGILRGIKRDLYEGGVRVPFLVRWPGRVPAGKTTDHISGFQDMFPTLLEFAGLKKIPATDGISMRPLLTGQADKQKKHRHLYWEFHERGGSVAVLKGDWKAVQLNATKNPNGPVELYDLSGDPSESKNIAAENPNVVAEMRKTMKMEHRD